ncbi:MAG: DUF2806 domain-containing protein [Candidatus Poribacteria bacterium]|nr:DUF2806 domain-containing protein [Candidatus Poribacteria bacterium]
MSNETKPNLPVTTEDKENVAPDIVPENTGGNALDAVTNFISGLDPSTLLARNASKALRQLCSAPKDWFDAYFEGKAAETLTESEGRVRIREEITDQIVQNIKVDPEYARRAGHKFAEKIIGEQLNLDNISTVAANELMNNESDNSTNQDTNHPNETQSADSTNQNVNDGAETTINDDWLNNFETQARQVSTEDMRLRFGRLLAGEIEKPGSYSIKAVKTLGELDQNVANLFKKLCSLSTGLINASGNISSLSVLNLEDDPLSFHTLEKYGPPYHEISVLQEYDLALNADFAYLNLEKFPALLWHQGQNWIITAVDSNGDENQELQLFGIQFSHVGQELYSLVDQDPVPEYTEELKKFLAGQNLSLTEVDIISIDKNNGMLRAISKHG